MPLPVSLCLPAVPLIDHRFSLPQRESRGKWAASICRGFVNSGKAHGQVQPSPWLPRLIGKALEGYTVPMNYQERITMEPGKRGGKPCIRGLRITVYDVLSYLASGMTHEQILADFPDLTKEDILACLSYAADRESHLKVIAK